MKMIDGAQLWMNAFKSLGMEPPPEGWEPYLVDFLAIAREQEKDTENG